MNVPNIVFFFLLKRLCLAQPSSSEESIAFEAITYFLYYIQLIIQDGILPKYLNNIGEYLLFENVSRKV